MIETSLLLLAGLIAGYWLGFLIAYRYASDVLGKAALESGADPVRYKGEVEKLNLV